MPIYILASKLTSKGMRAETREKFGQEWMDQIKKACPDVKWLNHFAVLGPYDFISLYEAPDEKTAMKVSLITLSMGAVNAESWTAMPYSEFLDLTKSIQ
ncbi:MAG: GYD domain-containing protein [Candidatus Kariarchaeaceae archaeon]|jgi:uncharacterized protein with GYD domain